MSAYSRGIQGFTLIEVLVALAIVATALAAGVQATQALTRNAQRQTDTLLATICAENELVKTRLSKQMPGVGDSSATCEQAGRTLHVRIEVRPTPNPSFRRVDALVSQFEGKTEGKAEGEVGTPILSLSTIVGRF